MRLEGYRRHSLEARAVDLLALLDSRPEGATKAEAREKLGWTESQFTTAVEYVRSTISGQLGVTIPHPVPDDGYRYRVTGDWIGVDGRPAIEAGTSFALGQIESRLRSVHRDVLIAKNNLEAKSLLGRKLNYLDKHLARIFAELNEIGTSSPGPSAAGAEVA